MRRHSATTGRATLASALAVAAALVTGCPGGGGGGDGSSPLGGPDITRQPRTTGALGGNSPAGDWAKLGRRVEDGLVGRPPPGFRVASGSPPAGGSSHEGTRRGRPESDRPGAGSSGRASLAGALAAGTFQSSGKRYSVPEGSGPPVTSNEPFPELDPELRNRPPPGSPEEVRERVLSDLESRSAHLRYLAAVAAGELRLREAVPLLARLVRRSDVVAPPAIASLGLIGGRSAAAVLADACGRSRGVSVRMHALRALAVAGADGRDPAAARTALKALVRALDDKLALVRIEAAHGLSRLGLAEAAPALRETLARREAVPGVKVAAASALARLGDPAGMVELERALASGSPELGVIAIRGLAAFAARPVGTEGDGRTEGDSGPAATAFGARALRARAARDVAGALTSPHPEVWSEAVRTLAVFGPAAAAGVLDAIENASPAVPARARVVRAAWSLFHGPSPRRGRRWVGGGRAGGRGASRAREELERALLDPSPHLRAAACDVLGASGDRGAAPALARSLRDTSGRVRLAAAFALGMLGGDTAVRALEKAALREDPGPDPALGEAVRRALAVIRYREGTGVPQKRRPAPAPSRKGGEAELDEATPRPGGKADAPYELERIVTGAGGVPFCVLRARDGTVALLKEGEETSLGHRVERIVPGKKGSGTVFLARDGEALTLRTSPE